ncbi:MAG TPA: cell wall hydrolase [Allosphingosinicella sp.]|nr:cell wall hydrolase [Allosphingosinicella sp.]
MSFFGKPLAVAVGAVALSGAAMAPLGFALAAGSAEAHQLPHTVSVASATPTALPATPAPAEALVVERPAVPEEAEQIRNGGLRDLVGTSEATVPVQPETQTVDAELVCLAKVVVHEAGNQPRAGQLAVAQVVMNRVNDPRGRFGRTICGVIMQRGQFFNVHAYNPSRTNQRWRTAVEVAREARHGASDQVMDGALFFHAASANMSFRGRQRIGRLAGHVFYR